MSIHTHVSLSFLYLVVVWTLPGVVCNIYVEHIKWFLSVSRNQRTSSIKISFNDFI